MCATLYVSEVVIIIRAARTTHAIRKDRQIDGFPFTAIKPFFVYFLLWAALKRQKTLVTLLLCRGSPTAVLDGSGTLFFPLSLSSLVKWTLSMNLLLHFIDKKWHGITALDFTDRRPIQLDGGCIETMFEDFSTKIRIKCHNRKGASKWNVLNETVNKIWRSATIKPVLKLSSDNSRQWFSEIYKCKGLWFNFVFHIHLRAAN